MATDKIRKYVLPNIPYLFIGWFCLKIGTAYRLAAGAGFGEKLLGLGQTIGAAFASFAPGLAPLDWFVGIVGAVGFRLLIYCKAKKAKKFRRDAEYGTARWGNEKDIKPFIDSKFENNMLLTATERLTMNTRPQNPANARNLNFCGIGSSGSGKTRFWLTPQLLFRERVISWVIETFEKYSIFELHGDELDEPQDLTEYQAGYLPDGAILQDTTKQPNTEPGIVLYKYAINEAESFEIMITQSDNRVYFDTENTKIEPFDKGGVTGYFFQKDGMSYICFERDGCFFSVYGSIDTDELAKIAASITKK